MKTSFIPISLKEYVELHLKSNPSASRVEITTALKEALEDYKKGEKCLNCGNPIWVIGSAFAENMCFTCITGEAIPEDDFEIDEACY
ncbi:MAG: hypothetical protein IBX69_17660 [Anaerolineales bacterium]|nr:hypothetical protein [Anaerolineales bacterium]